MKKSFAKIASIIGALFVILALIYWLVPGKSLPHFIPGYGKSLDVTHPKRAIASLVVAIIFFIVAWFKRGKKSTAE